MHVLDERFHTLANFSFPNLVTFSFLTRDFVSRECLSQYSDEWPIAGQEDGVRWIPLVMPTRRDVESDECFSSAGNTGDKADDFPAHLPRLLGEFFDAPRGDAQVLRACVESRNRFN